MMSVDWTRRARFLLGAILTLLLGMTSVSAREAEPTPDMGTFTVPPVLLCDGTGGLVLYNLRTRNSLPLFQGVDVRDVEPQPDGSYLVVGHEAAVALYRKKGNQFLLDWSWEGLNLPCVTSAVVADSEWKGIPSLILAADCTLNRIFLAEAKSQGVKIRWDFNLPATPRRVSVCGDSGNFLVVLKSRTDSFGEPPKVAEVFFKEERIGWSLDSRNGVTRVQDAVRDPRGRTLVVAGSRPELMCFDKDKKVLWRKTLGMTPKADHTLSYFERKGRTLAFVYARPEEVPFRVGKKAPRAAGPSGLYLVDVEDGKILAFTRSYMPETQSGRAPLNIVPQTLPVRSAK